MNIDKRILFLACVPFIAIILCVAVYLAKPTETNFIPDRPEFLTYVDQLNLYSQHLQEPATYDHIRDVFHHNGLEDNPIIVSMIVKNGSGSYSIINGDKMGIGDRTTSFRLVSIDKSSITVAYNNGAEETVHVNTY